MTPAANRKTMSDGMGSVTYNYNNLSQLTSEVRTFTGVTANGLPAGTIRDSAHADRVLVPLKDGAYAVYQIAKNGTAKLKTVLIAHE